jgi:hypothetical protein
MMANLPKLIVWGRRDGLNLRPLGPSRLRPRQLVPPRPARPSVGTLRRYRTIHRVPKLVPRGQRSAEITDLTSGRQRILKVAQENVNDCGIKLTPLAIQHHIHRLVD